MFQSMNKMHSCNFKRITIPEISNILFAVFHWNFDSNDS